MKKNSLWMGFEIQTASGSVLQPTRIIYWQDHQFKSIAPESPFHYKADALVGLALIQLNHHLQNPFSTPKLDFPFAQSSWLALEPHHEMFVRSQPRVQAMRQIVKPLSSSALPAFERQFTEILDQCLHKSHIDLAELTGLIKTVDVLESKLDQPLLYNFQIHFSAEIMKTLLHLHSLLFNLRALIAMDHNALVQDPTFDAARMDSISDYLPKPEYVSNDAILYSQFKKLAAQMPEAMQSELNQAFVSYSHNATCLVESLPKSFLKSIPSEDLEDTLYLTQMDWLLGTDSGLLFRVREELYGILEGYEKIFWPELAGKGHQAAHHLTVNCQLTENDLNPTNAAA